MGAGKEKDGDVLASTIAQQLRQLGAEVLECDRKGEPTLLVGYGRQNSLMDVKGCRIHSTAVFRDKWPGRIIREVSTLNEACQAAGMRLFTRREQAARPRTGRGLSGVKRRRDAA